MRDNTLTEAEIDHIVDHVPLKLAGPVRWEKVGVSLKARVEVVGARRGSVAVHLVMDLTISLRLQGKYSFQLRQRDGQIMRRLDIRGSHRNGPHTGSYEQWAGRTHKHRYRSVCADGFAYTPTDIPDTTSPPDSPAPSEHGEVFWAFCEECGIEEPAGHWSDPPLPGPETSRADS